MFGFLLLRIGILYKVSEQLKSASNRPHKQCTIATNCMNFSSSVLWALIGGPSCFAFFSPPNAKAEPANNVPRVAIESYINTRD